MPNVKHAMIVRLVEESFSEEDGEEFAQALLAMMEKRCDQKSVALLTAQLRKKIEPIFETEQTIGAVQALIDVARRVLNISKRYGETPESENLEESGEASMEPAIRLVIADKFAQLSANIMEMARRKSQPVMVKAAEIRAEANVRARQSN